MNISATGLFHLYIFKQCFCPFRAYEALLILLCLHDYLEVVATLQYHVLQEV